MSDRTLKIRPEGQALANQWLGVLAAEFGADAPLDSEHVEEYLDFLEARLYVKPPVDRGQARVLLNLVIEGGTLRLDRA